MENEIYFLKLREFDGTNKKTGEKQHYRVIDYVYNLDPITEFVGEEQFDYFLGLNLEGMKKYKVQFEMNPINRRMRLAKIIK